MTRYEWRTKAPKLIYNNYPDVEVLCVDPPEDDMIGEFSHKVCDCGDSLFLFLCREASDSDGPEEYLRFLERALRDIQAVKEATERMVKGEEGDQ